MTSTKAVLRGSLKIVYWKGERFWLGRLVDHPETMSQGESVEELEENLRDAYRELLAAPQATSLAE